MGKIEDLREIAPCGMIIHYSVNTDTDMVTYTDINDRGEERFQKVCKNCSWRGICKPTRMTAETAVKQISKVNDQIFEAQECIKLLSECLKCMEPSPSFVVHTPQGNITAKQMPDKEYPGICLEIESPYVNGRPGCIIEYDPNQNVFQIRIFGEKDSDGDPIEVIRVANLNKH